MQKISSNSVRIFYPKFDKKEIIRILSRKLEALQKRLPLMLVVFFGSYVKECHTVASDVDVLIVYKGERMKDAYAIVKRTLEIPHLQPHVYTEQEYQEMKDIIHRMVKDGIVIFNSEATME